MARGARLGETGGNVIFEESRTKTSITVPSMESPCMRMQRDGHAPFERSQPALIQFSDNKHRWTNANVRAQLIERYSQEA